jgi:hypothetical protein
MRTETNRRRRYAKGHAATAAEAAAVDFGPENIEAMPTAEEWIDMLRGHCVTLRVAGTLLAKTKQELVEIVRKLAEAALGDLIDNILSAEKTFARFHEVTRAAMARLIAAGSVVELEEGA